MPISVADRFKHGWNAFWDRNSTSQVMLDTGPGYSTRPDRSRFTRGVDRSIVSPLYTRLAIDVAAIAIRHVRLDQNDSYLETIQSGLNNCLTVEANIDQSGRSFIQDVAMSLFDEGSVAIVPVDSTIDPNLSGSLVDVQTLRTGKVLQWYPKHVRLEVYNDTNGRKEQITLPKSFVAIIENPLYAVMNEPSSTLQRLIRKLNLLDTIDEQSGSGKLDLIFQLPYAIKTDTKRAQAERRKADIEAQLRDSKYGIAYVDSTEKVTQLNRPAENNLMAQIQYLTSMLYGQLGITENIFNGKASEEEILNYHNRTVEPVLGAVIGAMTPKFLTKTARTQRQAIAYFRNPFGLITIEQLTKLADSFTRNAIFSSNEIRAIVGYKPSSDPEADKLRNKNLNESKNPDSSSSGTNLEEPEGVPTNDGKEG